MTKHHHPSGFTLTELLVAIALVITLATIGYSGYAALRNKARMTIEINAARNQISAYLSRASDHSGMLLPGYMTDPEATNTDGDLLYHPMNARYPWRLSPYVPQVDGVLLYNGNEKYLLEDNSDYLVSVHSNLGINAVFVGGHYGSASPLKPSETTVELVGQFYLERLSQAEAPCKTLVFASARSAEGSPGYFEVRPPNIMTPVWSSGKFDPSAAASQHGFVDFRWENKAVAAMLAGNVELLDENQMRDMRRWSNQAIQENDPDFTVTLQ